MKLIFSFSVVLLLVLSSCNSNNNKHYSNQIDGISTLLNETVIGYTGIDSLTIAEIRKNIKTNCKRLYNVDDTIISSALIPYSHIDKSMKQILKMDYRINKEVEKSKSQLSNLLYDVDNNLIDTIILKQYIIEEKRIVNIITESMNDNTERIKVETHRYDSLNSIIEHYLNNNN